MPMRETPRVRRLRSDLRAMEHLHSESSILEFVARSSQDTPPDEYRITLRGRGAWRPANSSDVLVRDQHEITIRLGANYPRMMPELTWRSPIFHPNISGSGVICLGGYGTFWVPSLTLDELCVMLWDIARYANYDVKSPYNREAALWAKSQTQFRFPFDSRPLRDRVAAGQVQPAAIPPSIPLVIKRPVVQPDVFFLGEVVEAEVIHRGEADVLIIE